MLQVDYLPSVLFAYLELFRFIFLVCKHTHTHTPNRDMCVCVCVRVLSAQLKSLALALLYFTLLYFTLALAHSEASFGGPRPASCASQDELAVGSRHSALL